MPFQKGNIPWCSGKKCPKLAHPKSKSILSDGTFYPLIFDLCWCHKCNETVWGGKRYISGHQTIGMSSWNKGLTKEIDERIRKFGNKISKINIGRKSWNVGLTNENDERVRKNSENRTGLKRSKEQCKNISDAHKGKPSGRKGKKAKPETIIKLKESHKGQKSWCKGLTKETDPRLKIAGKNISKSRMNGLMPDPWNKGKTFMQKENHPNWKGGISKEIHPKEFNKTLRKSIRLRDSHICQLCNKTQDQNILELNRLLAVHHIDYDKKNNNFKNLITLCSRCHSKTNYYRRYYKQYFIFMNEN